MQEMQDSVEQTFKSGKLYGCDCHYGLSNVNPLNVMGYCLELLQLESIYLACPVFAASACPVYSRLVAALTYAANIKSLRSLHLQIWAPPCSSHILHKIHPPPPSRKQTESALSGVFFSTNVSKSSYFTLSDQNKENELESGLRVFNITWIQVVQRGSKNPFVNWYHETTTNCTISATLRCHTYARGL